MFKKIFLYKDDIYFRIDIMKIYKFNDLNFYKPNLIKIIGPCSMVKEELAKKLIISMHDKYKNKYFPNEFDNKNFGLTIFTYEQYHNYPKNIKNITTNYYPNTLNDKIRDFYLTRKFNIKHKKDLELHIVLFDINLMLHKPNSKRYKYIDKLMLNYKKLNLIIIYYDYFFNNVPNYNIDYTLCLRDDFDSKIKRLYKNNFDTDFVDYQTFKKTFKEITKYKCSFSSNTIDGTMVLKKGVKNKFYKLNKLYCYEEERQRVKRADPNYDCMSDDSNIRLM